jgi:hypothetical protein
MHQKKKNTLFVHYKKLVTVVAGKIGSFFYLKIYFQSSFDPKHIGNILNTLLNQIMVMKNVNNCHKPEIH